MEKIFVLDCPDLAMFPQVSLWKPPKISGKKIEIFSYLFEEFTKRSETRDVHFLSDVLGSKTESTSVVCGGGDAAPLQDCW